MSTADTKRIDGRYIVIPLVALMAITAVVFLTIQLSGRGAKETNYLLLSYTAALRDLEEGYYSDAVKNLTPVIKSGTRPDAFAWRGEAYLRMKNYEQAEADFREALKFHPEVPANSAGLGAALVGQGKTAEAEAAFEKAIALFANPGPPSPGTVRRTGDTLEDVERLKTSND